ncbi:MAG: cytochrome c3 family protein [Nitrosomonadales bacterium]|nr:cytochrome c3 family protein [Nitrosomonadales bacterium]
MIAWRRTVLLFALMLFVTLAQAEYADVVLNRRAETEGMRPVVFPHWFHRLRFTCNVCHPDIFKMRAGSNDVTMAEIIDGKFCGKCHNGEIAWSPEHCHRCHSGLPGLRSGFKNSQNPGGPGTINSPGSAFGRRE